MQENVQRIVEENGMRMVLERIPHVRSCSIGVWLTRGSRHEPPDKIGISHFLEHMVFKGTSKRNAKEIATAIESVGGSLDAFTGREYTCFHAKVLDEYVELAVDVLSDLINSPTISEENLQREKQVIYEEIRNMEDTPDDLIHQLYSETIWGDNPLGYPLLGTYQTVAALKRDDILEYLHQNYIAPNLVISLAGNIDFNSTIDIIREKFSFLSSRSTAGDDEIPTPPGEPRRAVNRHLNRDCQQTHLCLGTASFSHSDARRYALLLLSNIVGGGMSSRLFQRVREEEALAYVVYSFQQFYLDTGLFGVYVGTEPSKREKTLRVIREEYAKLLEEPVSEQELNHAKNQLKGQLMLGLESTTTRMFRLANFEINREGYQKVDEVLAKINAVTPEDITAVARIILNPENLCSVSLGPNHN
ncbi:MAG: insulinase family protein [Deltaproteobacteria bacterium]|nr:MAG: insulinase family protein [Deltaproteobacteria bacterium]